MNRSIDIGRLLGIRLRVQPMLLWLLAIFVLAELLSGGLGAGVRILIDLGMLSTLVVLHELGHALVARRFGVQVIDITLWPLGGMARMSDLPENPKVEAWVAIAGPAVNFLLAGIALPLAFLAGGLGSLGGGSALFGSVGALAERFIFFNLILGAFNLLPAFPMDGGRILRAFLATRSGWLTATERAVRVGRFLAWTGIAVGILQWQPILVLVSIFVLWAGFQELTQVRMRHAGAGGGIFDLFESARRAAENARSSAPSSGQPPYGHGAEPPGPTPSSATPDFDVGDLGRSGFSDEDIERLERYRGRLPGFGRQS